MTPDSQPQPKGGTARLVTIGAASFMAMRWSGRLIGLVSTVVLARLLVPSDFGLVAIATTFRAMLENMSEFGPRSALIRHETAGREFIDTVFTFQILRGILLAIIVAASSLILPGMMDDSRLQGVLLCTALTPLISGVLSPRMAIFERDLSFWREAVVQLSSKLTGTIASIVMALVFQSYWALIVGSLAGSAVKLVVSYLFAPYWPRFGLRSGRELLRFSGWLTGFYILRSLSWDVGNLLVGVFCGVRATGIYSVGSQLAMMPLGEFLPVISRTLFPGLVRFKSDVEKFRRNAMDATTNLAGLSMPIAVGFSFVASEFVQIVYGAKWVDAIPVVVVVAVCDGLGSIGGTVAHSAAMAAGRTDLLFRRELITLVIGLPIFVVATWLYGLNGALFAIVVGVLAEVFANLWTLRDLLQASTRDLVQCLWRAAVSTAMLAIGLLGLQELMWFAAPHINLTFVLAIKVIAGFLLYGGTRLLLWQLTGHPDDLDRRAISLLRNLKAKIGSRLRSDSAIDRRE